MEQNIQPGIQPLPLGQPVSAVAKTEAPSAAPSLDERVDQWLDAHPAEQSFKEEPAPVATTATPEAPPTQETPAPPPVEEPAPGTADSATPATKPDAPSTPATPEAKAPEVKPEPKPTAPEPVRFSLDAKYQFAEGAPPWTGQQIVDRLREYQTILPHAQEADVYREVFEMPAAQAKELWAPNIAWMRQNPHQVQMLASIIDDPVKANYILDCSRYWDSPEGQQLRQTQQQQQQPQAQLRMAPEVEARFKELETQNKQLLEAENSRKVSHATDRITRELNVAFGRYPFLRDNPALVQSLLARAWMLNGGDDSPNSKGVLDALEEQRLLYDAQLIAVNARDAVAPAPAQVPPLIGSGGASPQASQPMRVAQPKKFSNLDDATEDWINNPPAQFR